MCTTFYKTKIAATASLLAMAVVSVAGAFPGRGGSCTSCHSEPGGSLTISPDPLDIQVGNSGLLTFSITSLGGSSDTAISVQGLENPALNASIAPGGNNWTYRSGSGGMSYVSDTITGIGPYTLNVMIGGLATPGIYPIVVMYAGDGQRGTDLGFDLQVMMAALAGDYNKNGTVDAADYVVWRGTLGSTSNLAADGNGNNVIDAGDYTVWRSHFGQTAGSGSVTSGAIPEPATLAMLLVGTLAIIFLLCRPVDCFRS